MFSRSDGYYRKWCGLFSFNWAHSSGGKRWLCSISHQINNRRLNSFLFLFWFIFLFTTAVKVWNLYRAPFELFFRPPSETFRPLIEMWKNISIRVSKEKEKRGSRVDGQLKMRSESIRRWFKKEKKKRIVEYKWIYSHAKHIGLFCDSSSRAVSGAATEPIIVVWLYIERIKRALYMRF